MFDHIGISLFTGKGTPNLTHLTDTGNIWQGWQQYRLEGVCPLKVQYKSELKELRIKGSFPYLWRGHNYPADASDLREAMDYVSQSIGLNVFSGSIIEFEFGQFVNVPHRVDVLLANHTHLPGFVARGYINQASKEFDSKTLKVKLYDANRNFSQKVIGEAKQALRKDYGSAPGKHCLKIENHYKKPHIYFKQPVLVADLFNPVFIDQCKTDLLTTYQLIYKTPVSVMPTNKKDLPASMLPLLVLKDLEAIHGFSVEDLLTQKLKAIPEGVLTSEDKKARKRQLRKMLSSVSSSTVVNPYDVGPILEVALNTSKDVALISS
ncbi:hypothetical protein A6C57_18610 [Fibrella sp. ES10-3-2-2]|nr:hypothetical protein A6C57_18610 [Fibrella sp. ES10-3-2-2]